MQETGKPENHNINTYGIPNANSGDNPMVTDNNNSNINYFIFQAHNKKMIREQVHKSYNNYRVQDVFMRIESFNVTFSLQT